MKKPRKLQVGDTVAAVTLSWGGPNVFPYRYEAGKMQLEKTFGVKVVEMPHTLSDANWLRENPQARADDLMRAFADPAIDGIISTIGGDDSIRILPYLDLEVIRDTPRSSWVTLIRQLLIWHASRRGLYLFTGRRSWQDLPKMGACSFIWSMR